MTRDISRIGNIVDRRGRNAVPASGRTVGRTSIGQAIALFESGQRLYVSGRDFWRNHFSYTITISEKDSLYSDAYDWLIGTLPNEKHRRLTVSSSRSTNRGGPDYMMEDSDSSSAMAHRVPPLKVRFNDKATRNVTVGGYQVSVRLSKPEPTEGGGGGNSFRMPEYSDIVFEAKTYDAQQAVLAKLEELNASRATTRKAVLKMVNQWGGWNTRSDLPARTMDSVALPVEQKERIIGDLDRFLASEDQYNRLAIPWHRGYMLYGPPGTGKTSLVKALANHFNLDLWYVSLADLKEESSLLSLLSDVGPRSILLLEDIDTMRITHDRDGAEQGKINMSSLLNTLDGVATPHGLITVMTTNRFDILDPALTRAGRMDLVEELSYPTVDTLGAMYKHFFDLPPEWSVLGDGDTVLEGLSTGEVAELLKRNMNDPEAASAAVVTRVQEQLVKNGS